MTAATIEVIPVGDLEELLEHVPPCSANIGGRPCGKPSVARLTVTCLCGEPPFRVFLCARCLTAVKNGIACHQSFVTACYRTDFYWLET